MSLSLFNLIFIRSFIAWKNQSVRHAQKSVTTAFCSRVASDILCLAVVCLKQLFVQPSGTKELAFHAITATGWTPLKQHLSYSAAWTAVCCDFIGAGSLFRITYANACTMTSNGNSTLAYLLLCPSLTLPRASLHHKTKKMHQACLSASFLFYGAERVGFKPTVH